MGVYAGDVMTLDRWTIDAGVRVDWQRVRNEPSSAPANGLAPAILPALEYPGGPYHTWVDFSPRLGVTFRATNSTIVRGSYARYANQMGSSIATVDNPALMGTIRYTFQDLNRDHLAQVDELLGPTGFVTNVNPANPAAGYSPNQVDPNLRSPVTQVLVGGIEREVVSDFSLGVNVGRGVTSNTHWSPFIGLTSEHFEEYRPPLPAGVSLTTPVYRLAPGVTLPPGNGRVLTNREGYSKRYWNVDVVATKRLTNKWMFRGFVTWQQHREYFDDPARAIQDPTPRLDAASGFVDGGVAVNLVGGSNSSFTARGSTALPGCTNYRGG